MKRTRYSCQMSTKRQFAQQIFKKILRYQISLNFLFCRCIHNLQKVMFMKLRPMGAKLFSAYRWTDGHNETNSRSSQISNAPKKEYSLFLDEI